MSHEDDCASVQPLLPERQRLLNQLLCFFGVAQRREDSTGSGHSLGWRLGGNSKLPLLFSKSRAERVNFEFVAHARAHVSLAPPSRWTFRSPS